MTTRTAWRPVKTRVWFSGNLHLGHVGERSFSSINEMNETIINRWNERVAPDDTAWLLGDVAGGDLDETLPLLTRLHGRKYLVAGDNDTAFHGYVLKRGDHGETLTYGDEPFGRQLLARQVERYQLLGGFAAVVTGAGIKRSGHTVRVPLLGGPSMGHPVVAVSHFPYRGQSREGYPDSHVDYRPRPPRRGPRPWLTCGHTNDLWVIEPEQHQINVSTDAWDFAPVAADEIAALITDADPDPSAY